MLNIYSRIIGNLIKKDCVISMTRESVTVCIESVKTPTHKNRDARSSVNRLPRRRPDVGSRSSASLLCLLEARHAG